MIEARCDDREWGGQTVAPLSIIKIDFDRVWPWLRQAVDRWGETHRKWHVWRLIEAERAQLWTTENAAIVTTIDESPTGFKELSWWLAGGVYRDAEHLRPAIEAWAKGRGCQRAIMRGGRPGWAKRMPDYRRHAVVYTKDF